MMISGDIFVFNDPSQTLPSSCIGLWHVQFLRGTKQTKPNQAKPNQTNQTNKQIQQTIKHTIKQNKTKQASKQTS